MKGLFFSFKIKNERILDSNVWLSPRYQFLAPLEMIRGKDEQMPNKYFLITYGCQMNMADSERIAAVLANSGYKLASKINEADLILINMCSVRQSAVDRIFGVSQKFTKLKKSNPKLKTVLTGCLLKKDRNKFTNKFDLILNIKDLPKWPKYLKKENKLKNKNYLKIIPKYKEGNVGFVPISNGCNNFCSYCVVPFVRGPLICRDHKDIIKEMKGLVKKGFREIWLLGQNVNDYKSPINKSVTFPKLLKIVNSIPGKFWIRFMSPNPKNFSDELIEVMAESEKVAKYLNLPVQAGDNQILKKMNRPYTVAQYKNLVKKIRDKMPDINLSTDIIVGFPGESKKQFENTVKLFKEIKFNIAYISKYSPRPGTAAFLTKDNIPLKEKKRRERILREIIRKQKIG